jgi:hypothetical protein
MQLRQTWAQRWFWLRRDLGVLMDRLSPYPGDRPAYPLRRELGGWTLRSAQGWRQWPWITPPLHYTRAIPAEDAGAATDWAMERMGI